MTVKINFHISQFQTNQFGITFVQIKKEILYGTTFEEIISI